MTTSEDPPPPPDPPDAEPIDWADERAWLQEQEAEEDHWEHVAEARRRREARKAHYVQLGRTAILAMLDREHAIIWEEIVAKAGDYPWTGDTRIDPHHLRESLSQLTREGIVTTTADVTRGGRTVRVIHLANTRGRKKDIDTAAARKRLLDARYLGWASGTERSEGVIGPTAERVVHESLREASPVVGYRIAFPVGGQAPTLFGQPVQGGPLDNAAFYYLPDDPTQYLVAIEVKSLRPWVYPRSAPLFQVLTKAAAIKAEHQDVGIVPLLVARRVHYTTFRMARDLGFHVIDTLGVQWLPDVAHIPEAHIVEVRAELGYADLRVYSGADHYLVKQFGETIPSVTRRTAVRWGRVGVQFLELYRWLWTATGDADVEERNHRLNDLRNRTRVALEAVPPDERTPELEGGW